MGREVRDLDEEDNGWMDAIDCGSSTRPLVVCLSYANGRTAYALAIDLTARDVQDEAKKKGLPWTIAKGFDTFCPISDPIPKCLISDPHDVELMLQVNDKVTQSDNTGLMIFRIPRILSEISQVMALEKGDVVLTGTPKGVGEVKAGERMGAMLRVGEKKMATIDVNVEESQGKYEYKET